jgi:hypothetical protein
LIIGLIEKEARFLSNYADPLILRFFDREFYPGNLAKIGQTMVRTQNFCGTKTEHSSVSNPTIAPPNPTTQ